MYRHILVPTDGSKISVEAAGVGIALARTLGARVTALHVVADIDEPPLGRWAHGHKDYPARLGQALERRGAMYLEAVREGAMRAGVVCDCALVRGPSPSGQIVREARERGCDLIVMASHGRKSSGGLAGSETLKVVALAGIPVLTHHAAQPAATQVTPLRQRRSA